MIDPEVEAFLAHYGKKGMKWGVRRKLKKQLDERAKTTQALYGKKGLSRRERKKQTKAAKQQLKTKEAAAFRAKVIKSISSRSPSELYVVRDGRGRQIMMTGEEFVQGAKLGIPFTSITSTGQKIADGR